MHIHYFTLQRQVEFLRERLVGARVEESYTQMKNEWVLRITRADGEEGFVQLSADGEYPYILFLEQQHRRANSTGVMEEILHRRIQVVELLPGERIIHIGFDDPSLQLRLHFFTHHTNFFLVDAGGIIRNSFKQGRKWRGSRYRFPATSREDPLTVDEKGFSDKLREQPHQPISAALKAFAWMTGVVVRELSARCELNSETPVGELAEADISRLFAEMRRFFRECRENPPRVYLEGEFPLRFALTGLRQMGDCPYREFPTVNEALRFFCFRAAQGRLLRRRRQQLQEALERKIAAVRRSLSRMRAPEDIEQRKAYFQKIGQLIISQPDRVLPGQSTAELIDYFDPALPTISVKVDPGLSPPENAEMYFRRAGEVTEKVARLTHRREHLTRQLETLERLLAEVRESTSVKKLEKLQETLKSIHVLQPEVEEAEAYRQPYKRYEFGKYEIWVGRSARDNEAMTFRHAHKEDFWLHVQGYAGSHVIVRNPQRKEQLPPGVLNYAARLAVQHSQAKHAQYVPVMVTRVKYLRKPRKSPPGTVIPSRVKTIYVE
ncbi:MAG: DUF814 domain-containing protein [Calditrichaeota bacterium]|nr:MAG: DUF814 domain-containing protein [Calditrichota bacterium]